MMVTTTTITIIVVNRLLYCQVFVMSVVQSHYLCHSQLSIKHATSNRQGRRSLSKNLEQIFSSHKTFLDC